MPRILIVTGEESGDLHGGNLAKALKTLQPDVKLLGVGGQHMKAAGVELIEVTGCVEGIGVLRLNQIMKGIKMLFQIRKYLQEVKLDGVVFIDSPGLNLRLARVARRVGHRVVYYIAPQIWAWAGVRIKLIKRVVDRMIVIFPFEESLYQQAGVPCTFVGHPLLDIVGPVRNKEGVRKDLGVSLEGPLLGLLPGSRESEIRSLLPVMLRTAQCIARTKPTLRCVIAQAPSISTSLLQDIIGESTLPITIIPLRPNDVMAASDVLLVASGTATLQAALVRTPMVIVYKVSWLTYHVAKRLVKVPFIGLVNLVAGKGIVTELIQHDVLPSRLQEEVLRIMDDEAVAHEMRMAFQSIRGQLGTPGVSERAAQVVLAECQA